MYKLSLLLLWLLFLTRISLAQVTIGLPELVNYKSADYHAATGIFQIAQDKSGILYFANNDGLLTFNGSYWHTYTMPNKTPVKSLAIDPAGRIFVGGQDELGYFYPNDRGVLTYNSVKQFIPRAERQFADILSIVLFKNKVFFRSVETIFCLENKKIQTYDASAGWLYLGSKAGELFAVDKIDGLLMFRENHWMPACNNIKTDKLQINSINEIGNQRLLVSTVKNGAMLLAGGKMITTGTTSVQPAGRRTTGLTTGTTSVKAAGRRTTGLTTGLVNSQTLTNEPTNCTEKLESNRFAIGTATSGLKIIDSNGRLIQQFSNAEGLQSAAVHSIFQDRDKNLWLGLENGTAFINYQSPIKHIYPARESKFASNTALVFNNRLYLGTSNGVYSTILDSSIHDLSLSRSGFTAIPNTEGKVYSLECLYQQLFIGLEKGGYQLAGMNAVAVTPNQGIWTMKALKPDYIISGTYTGLELINISAGKTIDIGKIKGLFESLNNLAIDKDGNVWASNPNRGLYKLTLSADHKLITGKKKYSMRDGLPGESYNKAFNIRGKLIIATINGIYDYDRRTDRFKESAFFKSIFNHITVNNFVEDKHGNIWFATDKGPGVIDFTKPDKKNSCTVVYFPELQGQLVTGAEFLYPLNNENIFIGSNSGILHLNYSAYIQHLDKPSVTLGPVIATSDKDSLLFGGYFPLKADKQPGNENSKIQHLPNRYNSFHFEYASTSFARPNSLEFSYKLIGFDQAWSPWSLKTAKDYTNLQSGKYIFSVRVRNNTGSISEPARYIFVISAAWYQSLWAALFYLLLGSFLIAQTIRWQEKRFTNQQKKHLLEKERQRYLHSLELDKTENALIALQKVSLEDELNFKNKELASLTMHLVERGGIMLNIKQALLEIIKKPDISDTAHEFRAVFRILDDSEKSSDDWNNFSVYFDKVHNNFLTVIKTRYPSLSSTDLKLCAYLRLNLSSKEIAQLLNISLKGVEISRYRLRKKMQLNTEVNLYDFLMNIA